MTDALQVLIVTLAALAALALLVRPLFKRGGPASKPGGCANCAAKGHSNPAGPLGPSGAP